MKHDSGRMEIGFQYTVTIRDPDGRIASQCTFHNLFPEQGRNYMLASGIGAAQQVVQWYAGIFKGNYTPSEADVMSAFPAAAQEITAYAEASRQLLVFNDAAAGEIDTTGHEVVFTLTADTMIYGGFIASSQSKGSQSGVLLSAARFPTPQQGYNGQTVTIGAACSLVNI